MNDALRSGLIRANGAWRYRWVGVSVAWAVALLAAVLPAAQLPNAAQGAAILTVRDTLLDSLDAVKDLLMAENAYQLVQGNFDRVAAVSLAGKDARIPPSLEVLTQVLEVVNKRNFGLGTSEASQHIVILRQLPRDPFFPDPQVPAAQTWSTRAYASRSDDPQPGADVFDVSSTSARVGLDGTSYNTW